MTISMTRASLETGPIEMSALSGSEWRISDNRVPAGDAGSVLGFVEMIDAEQFELLQLGHGHGIKRFTFGSLREVAEYFLRSS